MLSSQNPTYLDDITLALSATVRNLKVDQDFNFISYMKELSRTSFFHLRSITVPSLCYAAVDLVRWGTFLGVVATVFSLFPCIDTKY